MKIIRLVFQWLVILLMLTVFVRAVMFIVIPGNKTNQAVLTKDHIAVIDYSGPIMSSEKFIEKMKQLEKNKFVKGYILRVNSPGGAVTPSQEIHDYLLTLSKPLYVSMGAVAASGGYMISLPAKKIYAMPSTITGSIGVIMPIPNYEELLGKIGIYENTIKSGKFKDTGSPSRPMTPEEEEYLTGLVMDMYEQFLAVVAAGRGMDIEEARALSDGRVYTGRQAAENGLVDGLGSWEDLFELIKEELEMPNLEYHIVEEQPSVLQKLFLSRSEDVDRIKSALPLKAGLYYMLEF